MSKTNKHKKMTITVEQQLNMESTARRNADIATGFKGVRTVAHKTKKDYNRKDFRINDCF